MTPSHSSPWLNDFAKAMMTPPEDFGEGNNEGATGGLCVYDHLWFMEETNVFGYGAHLPGFPVMGRSPGKPPKEGIHKSTPQPSQTPLPFKSRNHAPFL